MTKGKSVNLEGYVIRVSDYKENDCIITFLSREGINSFRARGVKKVTSKNHILYTNLVKARVTLVEETKSLILKESQLIKFPDSNNNFLTIICLQFLNEINAKITEKGESFYDFLDIGLSEVSDENKLFTFCAIYFAQFLRNEGYGLNVDECVVCRKKTDIVGISIINGGFLCRDDIEFESEKRSPRFLKIVRFCFRCKPDDIYRLSIEKTECLQVIAFLANLYEESVGDKIKSLDYFRKAI